MRLAATDEAALALALVPLEKLMGTTADLNRAGSVFENLNRISGVANLAIELLGRMDTMQVNVHAAKTQLSKLIEAALTGEDVIIARDSTPVVRLVPVKAGGFKFGLLADRVSGPVPDFLEPMSEEELGRWEGG